MISGFRGDYWFLSNFYPCAVKGYACAEAAFQAMKCSDKQERVRFKTLNGRDAKRLGRCVKMRSDWNTVRCDVMHDVLLDKFSDWELANLLLATGDEELIELNNWHDTFWGVDAASGKGENMLGKLLMQVRSELREYFEFVESL